jgi:perosamine synthetase
MTSIKLNTQVSGQISDLSYYLKENGIDSRPVFPTIHAYPMWETNVHNPVASEISSRSLNLPSGVTLSDKSIAKVSEKINKWLSSNV